MHRTRCWKQIRCEPDPKDPDSKHYRRLLEYQLLDRPSLPSLVVIQLNPSIAGMEIDDSGDPTSRIVAGWANRAASFGSVVYLNLFAWRSSTPQGLRGLDYETVVGGADHNVIFMSEINRPDAVVATAWEPKEAKVAQ